MFIPTHAKWISPPVCLAPLSTASLSSLLKSHYPACCSLSISPSASWLPLMSVPNWVWPPVHPGPAWLVTHLRSHPFAALSSPSLAALQLQGSADRENVINPIQIKRGYDKWWALHTSPFGIPSKKKCPTEFLYFFWLKSGQVLGKHKSEVWGVGAFWKNIQFVTF